MSVVTPPAGPAWRCCWRRATQLLSEQELHDGILLAALVTGLAFACLAAAWFTGH